MKRKLVSLAIAGILAAPSVSAVEVFKDEKKYNRSRRIY